jgi:exonuclease SbcC
VRPLSLTLEGFACFKQQQTVSFDGLELFAIWGATGSGKTSLLDAMVFALFGKVPRLGEKRNRDVISLTRHKAAVVLEFSTGPRTYRVARTVTRKGATEVKLEDGDGHLLAEGVRDVQAAIERCLGLPYDAFIQSVMLPQGEFARFLKSEPRERREILRDLLRLDIYERMREAAERRRRELDGELSTVERLLAEYTDAAPEHLKKLESALDQAQQAREIKHNTLMRLGTDLQDLETLRKKTEEVEQVYQHMADLARDEPKVRGARLRIEASERATTAMPHIVRAEDAEKAAREDQDVTRKANEAVKKAEGRHTDAERNAGNAEENAKQIGPLRRRIQALDELRGVLDARPGAMGRLEDAKRGSRDAEARVRTARAQRETLEKQLKELVRKLKIADETVRATVYDQDLDALAQRVAREATQLGEHRAQLAAAKTEWERTAALSAKADATVAKKAPAVERAHRTYTKATEARQNAELAYQDAHQLHAAAVLRRALRQGEACPVCAQRVSAVPKAIPAPKLDAIAKQYEEAKQAEADAREVDKKLAAEQAGLEASAAKSADAAAAAKTAFEKAAKRVTEREQTLVGIVGAKFDKESGPTVEARVLSAVDRLSRARADHATKVHQLSALERDRDVANTAIDGKRTEIDRLQEAADLATRQAAEIGAEVDALTAKITAVTTHPDPMAERAELAKEVEALGTQLEAAKATLAEAAANLTTAKAVATGAMDKAAKTAEDAAEFRRTADAAVKEARFESFAAAKAAVIEAPELARLRQSVEDYHVDHKATERRMCALQGELGGRAVTAAELTEAKAAHERARVEHEEAVRAVATFEEQVRRAQTRLEKRTELGTQQDKLKAEHDVYRHLADELKTDRFQEFVLEESFHDLARGASQRLGELTNRYALKYEDGSILVVDHDNADEMRSADTLSGGETFLASLALALELSEQIQQAAGAVLLESLFIDEGFGTLDRDALEGAASAIESLMGGGRMVGIITHIRDLADRLPCRIEVDWNSEGSRVQTHQL